jgi:tRNA G18 (ribose-2'-O)-methylase SpoU
MKKLSLEALNRLSPQDFAAVQKKPMVAVLDNIRSMNNVGSVFRTMDAFAGEKMILCGITATPPHREISKTALGAEETVAWQYEQDIATVLQELKSNNYVIVGVEQTNESISLLHFQPDATKKYAFVLGNEVFGISEEALPFLDMAVEIPQFGTKHSLNVSVAAGIVLWDFLSKMQ